MTTGELIMALSGAVVAIINAVAGAWILVMLQRNKLSSDKRAMEVKNEVQCIRADTIAAIKEVKIDTIEAMKVGVKNSNKS